MDGIRKPEEIRDLIMERVRSTRSGGLGDEVSSNSRSYWTAQHVQLLRDIRDDVLQLPK